MNSTRKKRKIEEISGSFYESSGSKNKKYNDYDSPAQRITDECKTLV